METLKEKRLRVLNETIMTYNINNRSANDSNKCFYFKEGTIGCAVGRLIADKDLCKSLDSEVNKNGVRRTSTGVHDLFDEIPKEVQELGVDFLVELQGLHDSTDGNAYWNENGLTENGAYQVEIIKKAFQLN